MKIAFVLPGLHKVDRGAEVAFISVARELANGGDDVTLFGGGTERDGEPYRFVHVPTVPRERFEHFPTVPPFRSETAWEEATFAVGLMRRLRASDFDITMTCGYPFANWTLRYLARRSSKTSHVFVTQNGEWPAVSNDSEFRLFGCDGLVCTNPDFFERNRARWNCALIPNGVDPVRFLPGPAERESFGLPTDRPVVLMVSACIDTKRVEDGIRAVAKLPGVHLAVAGDGPLRERALALAQNELLGRFTLMTVPAARMPALYRSTDAFLHMSKDEPFGNVYVEALACGLPVVGHDSARLRWIVGDGQFLVDTDDIVATSGAIKLALNAPSDLVQARIDQSAGFSWSQIAKRYRSFFGSITNGK